MNKIYFTSNIYDPVGFFFIYINFEHKLLIQHLIPLSLNLVTIYFVNFSWCLLEMEVLGKQHLLSVTRLESLKRNMLASIFLFVVYELLMYICA